MCGNDLLGGGLHSLCAFLIKFLLNNIIYCCFFCLFQKNDMENRKAVLDLKDVPPPPHHISSSQPSHPFSLTPMSLLPPRLPCAQITQDSHHQQLTSLPPPPKEGASPKVSTCTQCDHWRTEGNGLLSAGGGGIGKGSGIGRAPVEIPSSMGVQISSSFGRCGSCKHNLSSKSEILDPLLSYTCNPHLLSTVATSQPMLSHAHHSCCSGPLYTYPSAPFPGSTSSTCTSTTPPAPPFPCISSLPAPLYSSCLDSLNFCSCGMDCCPAARRPKRTTNGESLSTTNTTTTAHFCSYPLHLNVECTGCLKGAHFCQECTLKVG